MSRTLEHEHRITRKDLRKNPDKLYVFGDNLERKGLVGGQASAMRGEPNAVGIPTKRYPSSSPDAYFTDQDFERFKEAVAPDLKRLREFEGTIIWPSDGIGTGRAKLKQSAPKIWDFICKFWNELFTESPVKEAVMTDEIKALRHDLERAMETNVELLTEIELLREALTPFALFINPALTKFTEKKRVLYLNVYENKRLIFGFGYSTKDEAERYDVSGRVACVRVEYEEGEGL